MWTRCTGQSEAELIVALRETPAENATRAGLVFGGALRLGTETLAERINEAIRNAHAAATAASEADQQRFFELMDYAAGSLANILGPTRAKSG